MDKEKLEKFKEDIQDKLTPYFAPRDYTFRNFIKKLFIKSGVKKHYIDILLDDESMEIYNHAFTSPSIDSYKQTIDDKIKVFENVDSCNTYEIYEKLGDGIIHNFIGWYVFYKFPELRCVKDVSVYAIIKIKYGGKEQLAPLGEKNGFWTFISASLYQRKNEKKALIENTVEAFLGATSFILDNKIMHGVGYTVCYNILSNMFDELTISKDFQEQLDFKTKLKEKFDKKLIPGKTGKLKYIQTNYDKISRKITITAFNVFKEGLRTAIIEGTIINKTINSYEIEYTIDDFKHIKIFHIKNSDKKINDKIFLYYNPKDLTNIDIFTDEDRIEIGKGEGSLKKIAEKNAAQNVLENFGFI